MNKTTHISKSDSDGEEAFISFESFHRQLSEKTLSTYQATFSFGPFLKKHREKVEHAAPEVKAHLDSLENIIPELENPGDWKMHRKRIDEIVPLLFPALYLEGQMGFLSVPFTKEFAFTTPAFGKLLASDEWEISTRDFNTHAKVRHGSLDAGNLVLNRHYGQNVDLIFPEVLRIRHKESKMEKYFKINIILDYVDVKPVKPLMEISQEEIQELLDNWDDERIWNKYIPPENFKFKGMVAGYLTDVTDREILAEVEAMMAGESGKSDHKKELAYLQQLIRSYLAMPDVDFGSLYTTKSYWQESTTWSLLRRFDKSIMHPSFKDKKGSYGKLIKKKKPIIVNDLQQQSYLSALEKELLEMNYRSLLLMPVFTKYGTVGGIMELASTDPYRFNRLTAVRLEKIVALYAMGMDKFLQDINNKVRLTIQQHFTSIHPSVEWKFREVATRFFWDRTVDNIQSSMEPILFKDVYPLYGQADIVSSSKLRNQSIKADLIANLKQVNQFMTTCLNEVPFHLLDVYLQKTKSHLERLKEGEFISSDESEIVGLLTREIHPLLRQLKKKYPAIPDDAYDNYFKDIDEGLDIVYRNRKDYEESVLMLNEVISDYLEAEDLKMQKILPHYFEKYKTDGVEYNLYLGQSILEKGQFSQFYLKDFRLWQLIHMCKISRMVEKLSSEMAVPLTTAQLIFVYNLPLSIRFRMDEKQFDVDGAYNVRYEILKKRIDKALIKGTKERLTLSGKISIVWLHEEDKKEYLEYCRYLAGKGFITEDIEHLELETLQGAEGLRALRITVADGAFRDDEEE